MNEVEQIQRLGYWRLTDELWWNLSRHWSLSKNQQQSLWKWWLLLR